MGSAGDFGGKAVELARWARRLDANPSTPPACPWLLTMTTTVEPTRPDGARGRAGGQVRCGGPCLSTPKGGPRPSLRGGRSVRGSRAPRSEGWLCGCEEQAKGTPPTAVYMLSDRPLDVRWSSIVIADSVASSVVPEFDEQSHMVSGERRHREVGSAAGECGAVEEHAPRAFSIARRGGQAGRSPRRAAQRCLTGRRGARDLATSELRHSPKFSRRLPFKEAFSR